MKDIERFKTCYFCEQQFPDDKILLKPLKENGQGDKVYMCRGCRDKLYPRKKKLLKRG